MEAPQPYAEPEAYAVYSAVIQNESASIPHDAKRIFISDQTAAPHKMCLTPNAESEAIPNEEALAIISPAIADYQNVNQIRRTLKPEFHIETPYEVISADKMTAPFWIEFSEVGFDDEKKVAVLSVGYHLPHSYSGSFAVLFKKDGKWQPWNGWAGKRCGWGSAIVMGPSP